MSLEKCFRKITDQINLFHVTEHRKGYRKRPVAKELIKNRHKKNGFDLLFATSAKSLYNVHHLIYFFIRTSEVLVSFNFLFCPRLSASTFFYLNLNTID